MEDEGITRDDSWLLHNIQVSKSTHNIQTNDHTFYDLGS